jgi:hypothetical protein
MRTIEILPGTSISDAAERLVEEADRSGMICKADFNGCELVATPGLSRPNDLTGAYYEHCQVAARNYRNSHACGDELGAEVILTLVAILRSQMEFALKADFAPFLNDAKRVVSMAAESASCDGSHIKAARDIFNADNTHGGKFNNCQKAMLFIAAVELMEEYAAKVGQ